MQLRSAIFLAFTVLLAGSTRAEPYCLAPLRFAAGVAQERDSRDSLQAYLLRLRQQRDQILGAMQGQVQGLIEDLEGHATARNLEGMDVARGKLVQLGPEAAPLLVEHIDPGTSPTDPQRLRASSIALALAEMQAASITAKPAIGSELCMNGPSVVFRPPASALRTWTGRPATPIKAPSRCRTSSRPATPTAIGAPRASSRGATRASPPTSGCRPPSPPRRRPRASSAPASTRAR